ncbi:MULTISPECIES: tripartite tricarboxylate transporter permease [unclassified Oceanispirochaeta]|uniref:tripartite tricarboxylate transporter permease n=1 Tax=unclassified Oceanispirochaeta TaxID=2635722 RepID=UPI000E0951A1|nr:MULTISPECIES: tripartite tricarboxylate transporter permease [unclassified Oceanispirochaeta]MBF9018293.1 tripartite tricarboxylate transporter permease [Oceanispirochaeta sp. M2]NPD74758.1 C4-dicarboxylate ABC transporter permease [Oceanispirochaeta sp. M1]RDG29372.1 C4-dicarboxylate ABC transporter permease [Oceanispirochaeta sp. M1]
MEYLVPGLLEVLSMQNLLLINFGILLGMIFGAIPGLTGVLGMTLCLPLTFSMEPVTAIVFLLGIYCGGAFGGSITAILIGTPGTGQAAATLLDGYPLAKKGYAYKALMMALVASCIGGFISALSLIAFAPIIARFAMKFGPPEYFVLAIFGLSIVGAISGKDIVKGILMGCVGFFLAMIGLDNISGVFRFTFDSMYLYGGLSFIGILMGVFAISKVMIDMSDHFYHKKSVVQIPSDEEISLDTHDKLTLSDMKNSIRTIFKSSAIGVVIGAIPAAGGGIAAFMSYNEAKRSSKHPETFGQGEIEGVAAAESANNAITGSSLIPMLTVGIPGSGGAAALMGALTIQGLAPGPMLFKDFGFEMYAIMIGLILINIFMYFQGIGLMRFFVKVTKVPDSFILASLVFLCAAGTYSAGRNIFDVFILMGSGIVFFVFHRFNYPLIPVVLGFILGSLAEDNFRRTLVMSNGSLSIFLNRPICIVFIVLTVLILIGVARQNSRADKKIQGSI